MSPQIQKIVENIINICGEEKATNLLEEVFVKENGKRQLYSRCIFCNIPVPPERGGVCVQCQITRIEDKL